MIRSLLIILAISSAKISIPQTMTFAKAVNGLYFDVDILKASESLVDTFMAIGFLHHKDTVTAQLNLFIADQMGDKDAWSSRHVSGLLKVRWQG